MMRADDEGEVEPVEPTPEGEIAQNPDADVAVPPPPVRRFPVWVYFLGYVVETGKGRQFGNQTLKVPSPIDSHHKVRQIEELIAQNAKHPVHGIIGNRPQVTIINITLLGNQMVEEVVTAEGEVADAAAQAGGGDAGQHEES